MAFFKVSEMKNIFKKSRLLMSINEPVTINIGLEEIANSRTERILGLMFDRKLELETCIKQASNKKHTLTRIGYLLLWVYQKEKVDLKLDLLDLNILDRNS